MHSSQLRKYQLTILCLYTALLAYFCFNPLSHANRFFLLAGYAGLAGVAICAYPLIKILNRCHSRKQRLITYWLFPFILSAVTAFSSYWIDSIYLGRLAPFITLPHNASIHELLRFFYEFFTFLFLLYNAILGMWLLPVLWTIGEFVIKKKAQ